MKKLTDVELIKGCLEGDRVAQTQLYKQYSGKLYVVALRYCKSQFEAQDVLQESFIKIYQNISQFKGICPLEFWMRKITVNCALKFLKQQKRSLLYLVDVQENPDVFDDSSEQNLVISQFNTEELIEIIQQLATGYQLVFNLYAIEGYSHKEIGELLGVSESTSKSQYSRARKHIQNILETNNIKFNQKIYDELPQISL